jgi:redox-sensitive bicupin YhaK (pirin superfamily)
MVATSAQTLSPVFYVEATMVRGRRASAAWRARERAAYVGEGVVWCGAERIEASRMIMFCTGLNALRLHAESPARVMLLGGAPMDGERHLWWNFVSSSTARIEPARRDWKEDRFAKAPGETEFIPLPEAE